MPSAVVNRADVQPVMIEELQLAATCGVLGGAYGDHECVQETLKLIENGAAHPVVQRIAGQIIHSEQIIYDPVFWKFAQSRVPTFFVAVVAVGTCD